MTSVLEWSCFMQTLQTTRPHVRSCATHIHEICFRCRYGSRLLCLHTGLRTHCLVGYLLCFLCCWFNMSLEHGEVPAGIAVSYSSLDSVRCTLAFVSTRSADCTPRLRGQCGLPSPSTLEGLCFERGSHVCGACVWFKHTLCTCAPLSMCTGERLA